MLLTAVIAAAACFQQVQAEETQTPETTQPTITDASDYSVYNGYQYTIIQWTGGRSDKLNGLCYGEYHTASYNSAAGTLEVGDIYANSEQTLGSSENPNTAAYQQVLGINSYANNWNTILIDDGNHSNSSEIYYDISNVKISGLIVTAESNIHTLKANTSGRNITIGMDGGSTSYTTIAKDFTLNMNGASLTLAGTQVWNIDSGCTYTIQNAQNGVISSNANLTIDGEGTVQLKNALNNSGTLTVNGTLAAGGITNSGTLTVNGTLISNMVITNEGTLTVADNGKVVISSFVNVDCESAAEITVDYTVSENGIQSFERKGCLIVDGNNASQLTEVWIKGDTKATSVVNGRVDGTEDRYVVVSDTVTVGGANATEGTAYVDGFAVGKNGTLNITAGNYNLTASQILQQAEGTGTLVLSTSADIANGQSTVFKGDLMIASDVTLNFGLAKTAQADMSTLSSVTLDGGTLNYHGKGSTIKNLTVSANGGTFYSEDINNASATNIDVIQLKGDTTLTGNLALNTGYKGRFQVEHLEGAGALTITSTKADTLGTVVTIESMKDFTGTLSLQAKGSDHKVTVNATLDEGYTLNDTQIVKKDADNNTVNLSGEGTYNLGGSATKKANLAADWTGMVSLSGATFENADLNTYGNAGSTVKLDNVSGSLAEGTVNTNLNLVGSTNNPGLKINSTTGETVTFTGTITSSGQYHINANLVVEATNEGASANSYIFQGDVSQWKGNFVAATDANVTFEGNATTIANGIKSSGGTLNATIGGTQATTVSGEITDTPWNNADGNLSLSVTNTSAEGVTFANTVKVDSFSVAAGSKATLQKAVTTTDFTIGADGAYGVLVFDGGSMTVTNSITLSTVEVTNLSKYFNANDLTVDLITAGGIDNWGGSVNVGTYTADGTEYTTTVDLSGNSIVLTFAAKPQDAVDLDLMVNSALLNAAGNVLTLNLNGDLTAGCNVDLILSDAALADIAGMTGLVDLSLVATNGTFTSVQGLENSVNVSFYNGAYTGEVGGQFRVEYIPEPTTATLSLLALAGLAARRRRK